MLKVKILQGLSDKYNFIILLSFAEEGKYFIDFKNGSGDVGKGEPSSKADVTIAMNTTNFLKIFNRKFNFNKTGVINDPLGQTHNPANSDHYSNLKIILFCAILKSGTNGRHAWK